ncbi:MAG: YvrJ family protein [Selenomonas bovis]|nr:YvrJ family protein [Selenomonas bovis]
MEETLLTAISTVGFPIVVTFYLLTRFQKSMDNMTAQLAELVKVLQQYERRTA